MKATGKARAWAFCAKFGAKGSLVIILLGIIIISVARDCCYESYRKMVQKLDID